MIQELAKKAIEIIKSKYTLPDSGLLAGGSLANIIWELKSGNKAVINDIDIFVCTKLVELSDTKVKDNRSNGYTWTKSSRKKQKGNYGQICYVNKFDNFYQVSDVERDGIINTIKYTTSVKDYSIVIESFDINCTQIGYDIEVISFFGQKALRTF